MATLLDIEKSKALLDQYWVAMRAISHNKYSFLNDCLISNHSSVWPRLIYGNLHNPTRDLIERYCSLEKTCRNDSVYTSLEFLDDLPMTLGKIGDLSRLIDSKECLRFSSMLNSAKSLINKYSPIFLTEIEKTVAGFVPISNFNFSNFSDPKFFGLIFINIDRVQDHTSLAEDIIHEIAHHALFALTAIDRCIINPSEELFSPLRGENRPAIGVLHSAFAISRMLLWNRMLSNANIHDEQFFAHTRIDFHRKKLKETMDSLGSCEFTAYGREIIEEMKRLIGESSC